MTTLLTSIGTFHELRSLSEHDMYSTGLTVVVFMLSALL